MHVINSTGAFDKHIAKYYVKRIAACGSIWHDIILHVSELVYLDEHILLLLLLLAYVTRRVSRGGGPKKLKNMTFSTIFWAGPPPEKLKSKKKKGFQLLAPPPLRIPGHAPGNIHCTAVYKNLKWHLMTANFPGSMGTHVAYPCHVPM